MSRQSYSANQYSGGRTSSKSSTSSSTSSVGRGGGRDASQDNFNVVTNNNNNNNIPAVNTTLPYNPAGVVVSTVPMDIREQYRVGQNIPNVPGLGAVTVMDQPYSSLALEQQRNNNSVDVKNFLQKGIDNVVDFIKDGGILGNLFKGISSFSEDLQEKAISFSLNKKLSDIYKANPDFEDYESLDDIPGEVGAKVRDLESDLQSLRDGTFKQSDYTAKYGSGDVTNPLDASFNPNLLSERDERNLQNLFTPDLAYAVSGQTPQASMVNQYFANMNISGQSPLSSQLETDYNAAKQKVNNLLNITPVSQQFGYSADPYGGLLASNLQTNPFNIEYLRTRGLI